MNEYVIAKYLRLSSEDADLKHSDKVESNSIANQRDLLDAYIRSISEFSDATVLEFCDDGWSGKNFERPAVQNMLAKVRQGKIQCIVVKDISRFGRDYLTVGNYISRIFPFLGVRFIAVNDGLDSIRPMDVDSLDTSFKELLYDLYSRDLSRKVRSAKKQRAQHGDFLSAHAPYGYKMDPKQQKHLVVDPPAAEIVRRIFQEIASGQTTAQVARMLNQTRTPTPMLYKLSAGCNRKVWNCVDQENFWTNAAVCNIIRDERYLGKVVYGKRYYDIVGSNHNIKVSRKDWIVVEGTHEAIVTQDEYDHAQAALKQFVERDGSTGKRLLRKKVRCGICGHAMVRPAVKQPYYYCRTPRMTDRYSCLEERIPESNIIEAILDSLHTYAAAAVEGSRMIEMQNQRTMKDANAILKTITALKEENDRQKSQMKALYENLALGETSKTEYLAQKASLVKKCDEIASRIAALEAELEEGRAAALSGDRFVESFKQYAEIQTLTDEIVDTLLEQVTVFPGGRLNISWKFQDDLQMLMERLDVLRMEGPSVAEGNAVHN